jgi:hypothetical protein
MAQTVVLQDSFDRGMVRDIPRNELPKDALYNVVNMFPDIGAPLRRRGPWSYASPDLSATSACDVIVGGMYAPFEASAKNMAAGYNALSGNKLFTFTGGTATLLGTLTVGGDVKPQFAFHRDLAIITDATAARSYDGTTFGNLAGSPPVALFADVYKDFSLLARTTANPERLFFSAAGNPESWTTGSRYWDATFPLTAIKTTRNAILLFSAGRTERLRGNTPPPGGDMVLEPLFDVGCLGPRSVTTWGENVVWANVDGIFITNGSALDDVTASCGMKSFWTGLAASKGHAALGTYGDYLIVTLSNSNMPSTSLSTETLSAAISLRRRTWWPLSNINAWAFWKKTATAEELYSGTFTDPYVGALSTIFEPTSSGYKDADATDSIDWTVETAYYKGRPGLKTWKRAYLEYDLRNGSGGGTNAAQTFSYITSPELTSYTSAGTLDVVTKLDRKRVIIGKGAPGLAFAVEGDVASKRATDVRIYSFGADVHERELSRVA